MKVLTLIPARGGSKGIPRKNLIDLCGKPLLYYTISASLNSNVNETWVSSEDEEILNVAKKFGAETIQRPKELSRDTSPSEDTLLHFAYNNDFDIIVFLQATSPLITHGDINKGIALMKNFDSVITVCELNQFVWFNNKPSYDINKRKRRQDFPQNYIETGSMFITTKKKLLKTRNRISGKIGFLILPKIRSFDIDTYDDLELVSHLIK